jgi:hypothetical protein
MRSSLFTFASLVASLAAASCGGSGAPRPAPDETARGGVAAANAVVAAVNGATISGGDLSAEMRRTGKGAREALADLIDFELLAAAATRAIGDADPDVQDARDRGAVQSLIERELEPRLQKDSIPEADLRALYDKARAVFVHPRLVEIALLSVYTGARMKDEPRARALDAARALDGHVRARPNHTPEDFKAIADDPTWRDRHVKYARVWQALDEPFPAEVGRAAAALARPGDTTPLVLADSGYYIARYIGERPPENVTFVQAQPTLRDQIYDRWRRAQFLEFVQRLASPHQIEAFPERLDAR